MCKKRSSITINILKKSNGYSDIRIDPCLKNVIEFINERDSTYETLAACCGHGRYPMTIVIRDGFGRVFELFSGVEFPYDRKKFYKMDSEGYYYIPEVEEGKNEKIVD